MTTDQGTGVVVATGGSSELGRISALLGRVEQFETPLVRQMNAFARHAPGPVGLGLLLAFEPAEPGVMKPPATPPGRSDLSGLLVWRVVLVSVLFAIGAFGMFAWSNRRGLPHETARTMVVNTVVVMEIFYLFSVRYIHGTSVTWQGVFGTPAVLIGVVGIIVVQLAFTYLPIMQTIFQTRSLSLLDGIACVGVGVVLLVLLEIEKWLIRRWGN